MAPFMRVTCGCVPITSPSVPRPGHPQWMAERKFPRRREPPPSLSHVLAHSGRSSPPPTITHLTSSSLPPSSPRAIMPLKGFLNRASLCVLI
ncbi:hypothetical protein E2C01_008607 [Portunus trituberculatus]|uniref:Uncharacterized protein n=1 Tax=Portunus trituberculatus TaxID=210409 RepID=A0A5B7D4C8_PORTR|nr:hypothetical protein [Portunus trituberculatus]